MAGLCFLAVLIPSLLLCTAITLPTLASKRQTRQKKKKKKRAKHYKPSIDRCGTSTSTMCWTCCFLPAFHCPCPLLAYLRLDIRFWEEAMVAVELALPPAAANICAGDIDDIAFVQGQFHIASALKRIDAAGLEQNVLWRQRVHRLP